MNLDLYENTVGFERWGMNSTIEKDFPISDLPKMPIVESFLADDQIQVIQFCSTSRGMVWTIAKKFKK